MAEQDSRTPYVESQRIAEIGKDAAQKEERPTTTVEGYSVEVLNSILDA